MMGLHADNSRLRASLYQLRKENEKLHDKVGRLMQIKPGETTLDQLMEVYAEVVPEYNARKQAWRKREEVLLAEVETLQTEKAALKETLQKVLDGRCAELEKAQAEVKRLRGRLPTIMSDDEAQVALRWTDEGASVSLWVEDGMITWMRGTVGGDAPASAVELLLRLAALDEGKGTEADER